MEIEAKYRILDEETYALLAELTRLGGFALSPTEELQIHDLYVDTADHDMLRRGYACRRRRAGGKTQLSLKSIGATKGPIHRREELNLWVESDVELDPQAWPDSVLRERVVALVGDATLIPLFTLEQTRRIRYLTRNGGEVVAEMALDRVEMVRGKSRRQFNELEIEIVQAGAEEDLESAVVDLVQFPGLVPEPSSKFERGLAFAGDKAKVRPPTEHTIVSANDTMGEAARKILRPLFLKMQANEQGTYAGEGPEALHDMRVATRRMRTLLRIAQPYIDADAIKAVRKDLRCTARTLGGVRDLDVFREKTEKKLKAHPERRADAALLMQTWDVVYAERRNAMVEFLGGKTYAKLKQRFWALLDQPLPEPPGAPPLADVLPKIVHERLQTVLNHSSFITDPETSFVAYHQLRIDVKRLRYTLEFFREPLDAGAAEGIEELKVLQDHLGDLQDAVIAALRLRAVINYGTWELPRQPQTQWHRVPPATPPGLDACLAEREEEIEVWVATFPEVWHHFLDFGVPAIILRSLEAL